MAGNPMNCTQIYFIFVNTIFLKNNSIIFDLFDIKINFIVFLLDSVVSV